MRLAGRAAVVTGAAVDGTGFGIAEGLLAEGASVLLCERNREWLDEAMDRLATRGRIAGTICDVAQRIDCQAAIDRAIAEFGRLDVLVNNAAASTPGLLLQDMDDAAIAANLDAALYGTIYMMQAAYPHLRATRGSVINFGSRNGVLGAPGFTIYAAAKEGIRGLSRSAAREWGPDGIRVNVICPTSVGPGVRAYLDSEPGLEQKELEKIPLGYFGTGAAEIAPVAIFLASDESHYVTGQTINVDGGQVML